MTSIVIRSSTRSPARDHALDQVADVVAFGLGEEADVSEVDTQHRSRRRARDLGAAQDGAVATEDDDQLASPRRVGTGLDDDDGVGHVELAGLGREHPYRDARLV